MLLGTVLGIVLGPKSNLLEKDLYIVSKSGAGGLFINKGDPNTNVTFPEELDVKLERSSKDAGDGFEKVLFRYDKKVGLLDKTGALKSQLGINGMNGSKELWLRMEKKTLPSGAEVIYPEAISSIGNRFSMWMSFIGKLFMRLIKMVIVPLVFSSIVVGVAGLGDVRKLGRLGTRTLGLYFFTTAVAVSIGIGFAHLIRPGTFMDEGDKARLISQFEGAAGGKADAAAAAPSAWDNILNIVPDNPIGSMADGNMLQVIFFAILFGIGLTLLKKERSKDVVTFLDTIQHVMILMIHMVMALAPIGVFALLAEVVGKSGVSILKALVVYGLTVLLGLLIHGAFVYGGLVRVIAKLPILDFLRAARPAQLIAFSTSSSSASLPVTMECAEENLGISNGVSSFVLPLGSTVNMDGTALYQGVAAIFIAQVFGIDLSLGEQLGIIFAATAASVGAAGVPGAGMITLTAVLTASGIPAVGVALILGADRILDMFRTAVNVTGDLAVTAVMAVSEGENLSLLSRNDDKATPSRGFERRLDKSEKVVIPENKAE